MDISYNKFNYTEGFVKYFSIFKYLQKGKFQLKFASMLSSSSIAFEDITDLVDNLINYVNKKGR